MESLDLANEITDIIVDRQGEDIIILDLREVTTFTDFFVICTADTRRQLRAIMNAIQERMKQGDTRTLALNVEGDAESGWVLIDYNSVIVHLFSSEMRDYYRLEELWKNGRVVAHIQ